MRTLNHTGLRLVIAVLLSAAPDFAQEFSEQIRPVLVENCAACHNPANPDPRGPANFLKATTSSDIQDDRGLWRNVASQLRNRTMPPGTSNLGEADRLHISQWLETELLQTACAAGDYAGTAVVRRLNRREYRSTVRDLLGVSLDIEDILPVDGTGGAGFDTNGETLYIPPMLLEGYLQAAQQILDDVIVTPPLSTEYAASGMLPAASGTTRTLEANEEITAVVSIYLEGEYDVRVVLGEDESARSVVLKVDGVESDPLGVPLREGGYSQAPTVAQATPRRGGNAFGALVRLGRGTHTLALLAEASPVEVVSLRIEEGSNEASPQKRAAHYRLLGHEPGMTPLHPRNAAVQLLSTFLPKAFRRPVSPAELEPFLALYDRAAARSDPYEERVKLALKSVLVSPGFLFQMEERRTEPGIYPLSDHELASRLSYFLWSTMPDDRLSNLADQGRLQDSDTLAAEVDRMLDDPRSRTFVDTFIGQWLGTRDIGGRLMPLISEIRRYYNAEIAADLREQPILLFDRIIREDRNILELLDGDYMYLTSRLVEFYQFEDSVGAVNDNQFHLVQMPNQRRAGLLGLAGILGMGSHYEQTSPILRGAWVLDALLGTPVPPPPPDVPLLDAGDKVSADLTTRQIVMQHQQNPTCAACHKLMDPIGFGLENFDWMGRWRDAEKGGQPIDATGVLPSGERFDGPVELRQTLLARKNDFTRHLVGKVLGYALGRSLQDGDSCTIQQIVDRVADDGYRARTMIREIILSLPFRNVQGGLENITKIEGPRLSLSAVTARTQDAKSHDNKVKDPPKRIEPDVRTP
jgi:hypothetical protein